MLWYRFLWVEETVVEVMVYSDSPVVSVILVTSITSTWFSHLFGGEDDRCRHDIL